MSARQRITIRTRPLSNDQFRATVYVDGENYASVYGPERDRVRAEAEHYAAQVRADEEAWGSSTG